MKFYNRPMKKNRGFTLAELAVVLVIVGLLLGGLFVPLTTQSDIKSRNDTNKQLSDIREALIGFVVVNGRLPCPADRTIQSATTNAGVEATTGIGAALTCACTGSSTGIASVGGTSCSDATHGSATGVLPWSTLGLPETDAWGNRFTYRVTLQFARAAIGQTSFWDHGTSPPAACIPTTNPTGAAFALCSDGDIQVLNSNGGTTLTSFVPVIVIAHGKNPAGAWNTNGIQNGGATGDELENTNGNAIFVSNEAIDDQLIWISPNLLMNRMLASGKLP